MSQWRKLQHLAQTRPEVGQRLCLIYNAHDRKFLLDIRQWCSDWIESVDWLSLDLNASGTIEEAQRHFVGLLNATEKVACNTPKSDIVKQINARQAKDQLQERFSNNLLSFLECMQGIMREEKLLIQSCEPSTDDTHRPAAVNPEEQARENKALMQNLHQLSVQLQGAEQSLKLCTEQQNQFLLDYSTGNEELKRFQQQLARTAPGSEYDVLRQQVQKRSEQLQQKITASFNARKRVTQQFVQLAANTKHVVEQVWTEIHQWQHVMKLEITGLAKPKDGTVDILDKTCNLTNQLLLQLLAQLDKLQQLMSDLKYSNDGDTSQSDVGQAVLNTELVLKMHLEKVFVVDRCPQRVLKVITGKSLGFSMSCRILGGHALGLQMNPPKVSAELHKEQDVVGAMHNHGKQGMCTVVNGRDKVMELQRDKQQWIANFNSVQLQNVRQAEKVNDRLVMENLNGMVFYTSLKIRGKEYKLKALALPMVIISHVLQDCQARAFLIWDAAFSEDDTKRKMFEHPEQVPWHKVSAVLDALFRQNTGRGLRPEHLDYLAKIAFRDRKCQLDRATLNNRLITKTQLIKDKLQKDFQFWKWFYANMNLIKERLSKEWQDELIYGFIAKDETIKKLSGKQPGTFLLRFSESDIENTNKADICGCLTLAVYERDPHREGTCKVYHVKEHLTPKDIHERGLATTLEAFEVKDFETGIKRSLLQYLYPDREFHQTFNSYILEKRRELRATDGSDGYKAGQLRIEIFLNDMPPDTQRRRQLSMTHASPMSPTPSVSSDLINPLSPPTFPMSPPDAHDDTSMTSQPVAGGARARNEAPVAVATDSGKKIAFGVCLVRPQPNPNSGGNSGGSAAVNSGNGVTSSSLSSFGRQPSTGRGGAGVASPQSNGIEVGVGNIDISAASPPQSHTIQPQQQQQFIITSLPSNQAAFVLSSQSAAATSSTVASTLMTSGIRPDMPLPPDDALYENVTGAMTLQQQDDFLDQNMPAMAVDSGGMVDIVDNLGVFDLLDSGQTIDSAGLVQAGSGGGVAGVSTTEQAGVSQVTGLMTHANGDVEMSPDSYAFSPPQQAHS